MKILLYGREDLGRVPWETFRKGQYLKHFFSPLLSEGTKAFIENIDCEIFLMAVEGELFPLVLGNPVASSPNAYVASNLTQYIRYTAEEILEGGNKYPKSVRRFVLHSQAPLLVLGRWAGYEKVVFVNNWLLSTNLWHAFPSSWLPEVVSFLKVKFPDRAIVFKSVNALSEADLLAQAQDTGARQIVSRQVYMLDLANGGYQKKRPYILDKKLEKKQENLKWHEIVNWESLQATQAIHYYKQLYLEKYSQFNPAYRERFLEIAFHGRVLLFDAMKDGQDMVAIQAYRAAGDVITTPFIGYDRLLPLEKGIYRLMNLQLMRRAEDGYKWLNMSSGAADFKKMRGGKPTFEYNLVIDEHLPMLRRWPWYWLEKLSEGYIKPQMQEWGI